MLALSYARPEREKVEKEIQRYESESSGTEAGKDLCDDVVTGLAALHRRKLFLQTLETASVSFGVGMVIYVGLVGVLDIWLRIRKHIPFGIYAALGTGIFLALGGFGLRFFFLNRKCLRKILPADIKENDTTGVFNRKWKAWPPQNWIPPIFFQSPLIAKKLVKNECVRLKGIVEAAVIADQFGFYGCLTVWLVAVACLVCFVIAIFIALPPPTGAGQVGIFTSGMPFPTGM